MAAASPQPREKTRSSCFAETDRCAHVFEINDYSFHKGLGAGNFIKSGTFTVGGHEWCIHYHPDGFTLEDSKDYISVCLQLLTKDSEKRTELEASPYLRHDRLTIQCNLTVILGSRVSQSEKTCGIQVPPLDLSHDLGRLLDAARGTDVAFKVKGEVFQAHKSVLATRSLVFEAELYGPVGEDNRETITIEDMEPAIFRALLQFIYKDSLPAMDDLGGDEKEEMVKHLLAAADRYAVERMKLMCESILCRGLRLRLWRKLWLWLTSTTASSSEMLALNLSTLQIEWTLWWKAQDTSISKGHALLLLLMYGRKQRSLSKSRVLLLGKLTSEYIILVEII
ncbi:hypothetical protein HU200_061164 [Digitaria exilis]|uniref:Uncharacterized protein n=1 Tax=Digitaria exilis TaxID=1010633 RepID=A0A835A9H6_9POAL|nr:hypothetical protein HU200_061164 [Digitaria exilis]